MDPYKVWVRVPLPPPVRATGRISLKLFLPDAEDVHLLGIDTVEYERSIKEGVEWSEPRKDKYV
jgi:hypothetical protein